MRPVQLADIEIAARVLRIVPKDLRNSCVKQLLQQADVADRYRKRLGRPHPLFGAGSLMSAAMRHPKAPRPDACDHLHLDCIGLVVRQLAARAAHKNL